MRTRQYVRSRVIGAWNEKSRVISRSVLFGDFVVNQLEEEPAYGVWLTFFFFFFLVVTFCVLFSRGCRGVICTPPFGVLEKEISVTVCKKYRVTVYRNK